jgi:tetratricopeptide (TPR) repeat protein
MSGPVFAYNRDTMAFERRLEAVVIGPGKPGQVRVALGRGEHKFVADVPFDILQPSVHIPGFTAISEEVQTYRGFLLADAGRWKEARAFLENASPPEAWKSVHCYYLGHCYYEFKEYERAKENLTEAISLGLTGHWQGRAHYVLGLVEYHLSDMRAAKSEFEECVKTAEPKYLGKTKIWDWLEATSRALGLYDEAEKYQQRRIITPPNSKPN